MPSWLKPEPHMGPRDRLNVSVVYALPDRQAVVQLELNAGATVEQALQASGLIGRFPEIGSAPACAVFGKAVTLTQVLKPGDRIEILRPLLIDPKEARRQAARSRSRSSP
jgi:uncharacterized protein